MDKAITAASAPLPPERRRENPMPSTNRTAHHWARGRTRGPGDAICRLLGRLRGIEPDRRACWCIRCTLHHLGVYRREHVRYGRSAYVRTTVLGIRIPPDRYAFPVE